jgi:hypothetical protein
VESIINGDHGSVIRPPLASMKAAQSLREADGAVMLAKVLAMRFQAGTIIDIVAGQDWDKTVIAENPKSCPVKMSE